MNGYFVISEFVIKKGNIGQRLTCAEDFKKVDVKSFKGNDGVVAWGWELKLQIQEKCRFAP